MTNKYNFNPTPEQLADPEFWASDAVPEGAQGFYPEDDDFFSNYIKLQNGVYFIFCEFKFGWVHSANAAERIEKAIKRPADPNALKRCPCGQVPNSLIIQELELGSRYKRAVPDCCKAWHIEFRVGYTKEDQEIMRLAKEAWNALPRGFE